MILIRGAYAKKKPCHADASLYYPQRLRKTKRIALRLSAECDEISNLDLVRDMEEIIKLWKRLLELQ